MKSIRITLLTLLVLVVSGNVFAAPTPKKGNAIVLGKRGGKVQIIVRQLDGNNLGDLPFKPAYKAEIAAGKHRIQAFCIEKESWGQAMGPADEIVQEFLDGYVYQLELAGKRDRNYIVTAKVVSSPMR